MAHIERRGPKRWFAVYVDPHGRSRGRSFPRKLDAERFLAAMEVDMMGGRWIDPTAGTAAFGQYAAEWIATRPLRPATRARYESLARNHWLELEAVPLGALRPSHMRAWQHALTQRCAPSSVAVYRGVTAAILKSAVVDRIIAASPLEGVPLPRRPGRELVRPLEVETVLRLADAITPHYRAAVLLGAGTGVRRGEAFGLTVDRIDFLRRTVTVDRQLIGSHGTKPLFGPPKSAASVRVIPVGAATLETLAAHLATYPPDELVFRSARGLPVTRSKATQAWRDAAARVGIADTRFHALRHVYASTLIRAGESVKVVQSRLGHASAAETLDVYSHLWPADDDRTRAAIDAIFSRDNLRAQLS